MEPKTGYLNVCFGKAAGNVCKLMHSSYLTSAFCAFEVHSDHLFSLWPTGTSTGNTNPNEPFT